MFAVRRDLINDSKGIRGALTKARNAFRIVLKKVLDIFVKLKKLNNASQFMSKLTSIMSPALTRGIINTAIIGINFFNFIF